MFDLTRDFFEIFVKDYFERNGLKYNPNIFHEVYYNTDRVSVYIKKYYLEAREAYFSNRFDKDTNTIIDRFVNFLYAYELYVRSYETYPYNTFKQFRFICSLLDIDTYYVEEQELYNNLISYSERYLTGRLTVNRIVITSSFEDKLKDIYTAGSINYISTNFIKDNFYKIFNSNDLYDLYHPIDRLSDGKDKLYNLIDKYTSKFFSNLDRTNITYTSELLRSIFNGKRNLYNSLYNIDEIVVNDIVDTTELEEALIKSMNYLQEVN